jgi:hypothetical protein
MKFQIWLNLDFEDFSKVVIEFFLGWENFQIKVVEWIKAQFYVGYILSESRAVYEIVSRNSDRAREVEEMIA